MGQPHVGKSTVFAMLTGLSQRIDAWPGTSLERKSGTHRSGAASLTVIELPSLYSLSDSSADQRLICSYLAHERPDVIVFVADATALERTLYLLAEVIWWPVPIVLVLNMMDVASAEGVQVDPAKLQVALGVPVVAMAASRGAGETELVAAIGQAAGQANYAPSRPAIREDHRAVYEGVRRLIAGEVSDMYPEGLAAVKLLEGDEEITRSVREALGERWPAVEALLVQHDDSGIAIAGGRYEWIAGLLRAAMHEESARGAPMTDRLDRVATHPVLGLIVLAGIMGLLFWLIYRIGTPLQEMLELHLVQQASALVRQELAGLPSLLVGLLADGVIGGAGTVITILPILIIFFALMAVLEDCGYIARAAYVVDGFMHLMGLHGNSFLPLFLGFGCNVPAILGARTIPSAKARLLTIMVAPLVPCGARLAVLAVLTPVFFGDAAFLVAAGLVGLSLALLVIVGVVLHEGVLGGEHVAFIMELPAYRWPNLRAVGLSIWQQTISFLKQAGTVIVVVSAVMWLLATLPDGSIGTSYLAGIGRLLAPVGALMGLSWQMMVALVASFVRKENTIAAISVLYGASTTGAPWTIGLAQALTPAAGLAFLATQLLFIPCVATTVCIRQETRSWGWSLLNLGMLLVVSLVVGILTYHGARLLGV
jgi:ferrous iron transport protein B